MPKILRANEVAASLGISKSTLWRWTAARKFPKPTKIGPRVSGWRSSEVEEFITSKEDL